MLLHGLYSQPGGFKFLHNFADALAQHDRPDSSDSCTETLKEQRISVASLNGLGAWEEGEAGQLDAGAGERHPELFSVPEREKCQ